MNWLRVTSHGYPVHKVVGETVKGATCMQVVPRGGNVR